MVFMRPARMKLADDLLFGFGAIASQIKLYTRKGYTDLAKAQEKSLLKLINMAYSRNFEDMNEGQSNYPGIDYGDISEGIALQMTATVAKIKFQETVAKIQKYEELKTSYETIWFLLLTVEAVPSTVKITSDDISIQYITFHEITSKVMSLELEEQNRFISLLKKEYADYFQFNSNSFRMTRIPPIPDNLKVFNDFIETIEWFPENLDEGYAKVRRYLEAFRMSLNLCPKLARNILLTILDIKGLPEGLSDSVEIYADELVGALDLNRDEEFTEFEYYLNRLKNNDLVIEGQDCLGMHEKDGDLFVSTRPKLILNYRMWEPEINFFSVLPSFYEKYHSYEDFEYAIENSDFSLLCDSQIEKS